ncbi:MAG: protein kinase domain-containing protein [Planctomycetota bacterium]
MSDIDRVRAALRDRYTVEREIGRGGTAVVYLAHDLKHQRLVAVKVLRPELSAAVGSERFLQEIAVTATLSHPHILPLLDSGEADGVLFYVMPYVEGESLRQRMKREKQLALNDAITIAREVASALGSAHAHGIVHRDIKPENVLLQEGQAVVADFGIAKAISAAGGEGLTETGFIVGTPGYMSPEQAAGDHDLDGRSDLYALGCVLYEMLTGEPVFTGVTARAILARHMQERIPSVQIARPSVSDTLAKVVEKALAKVPADRFATAEDFSAAMTGAVTGRRLWLPRWLVRAAVVVLAGVALVYGGLAVWRPVRSPGNAQGGGSVVSILDPTRIAVLYFEDVSENASLGHLARGLTEDLIAQLSWVDALTVTSPEGVKPYRGSTVSVDSVARVLAVGSIVGGSVALSGDQVRVRVRLLDAATAEELFSRTFQDPWDELFALQDRVADEVALFLRERLGREIELRDRASATGSRVAWELVYRAEELADEGGRLVRSGGSDEAVRLFLRADSLLVEAGGRDPAWPEPLLVRARVAYSLSFVSEAPEQGSGAGGEAIGLEAGLSPAWLERAIGHADGALALDRRSAQALALRGNLRYRLATWTGSPWNDSLLLLAETDLRQALDIRPELAGAWYTLGELQYRSHRFSESAASLAEAYRADAYLTAARDIIQFLFFASLEIERFDEAQNWCETGLRRFPDDPRFLDCEITLLGWSGRGQQHIAVARAALADLEGRDTLATFLPKRVYQRMWIAALYARTGMGPEALAYVDSARIMQRGESLVVDVRHIEAYVRLLLGRKAESLRLLSAYVEERPDMRGYLVRSPWFKAVRGDPAFEALFRPVS